jgi:glycosyltransferase involved in cell wall biosynthesis
MRPSCLDPAVTDIADPEAPPARLRIGVLAHIQHPIQQPFAGGLEAFTYDITRALQQRGHALTLFASSASAAELNLVPIWSDDNYENGARKRTSLCEEYIQEHHAYLALMQGIDAYGFDVIFNNSLHYVPVTMASLIRTPMLSVLHTPPFFELINAYRGLCNGDGLPRGGRFCTISEANARGWQAVLPDCAIIPNGIDLAYWSPRGEPGAQAIWFGRLVPEKGAHLAIDAARLAGVPLRLAGQAVDPGYFAKQIAPRLGQGIEYLGHLPRQQLVEELASASVAVVTPCWEEPFGLVVAEALACGTPVAAFARGALADLLSQETGALAAPGDVPGLAAALLAARGKSRAACRRHAEAQWSHELMLTRYEQLLREVVAHPRAPGRAPVAAAHG